MAYNVQHDGVVPRLHHHYYHDNERRRWCCWWLFWCTLGNVRFPLYQWYEMLDICLVDRPRRGTAVIKKPPSRNCDPLMVFSAALFYISTLPLVACRCKDCWIKRDTFGKFVGYWLQSVSLSTSPSIHLNHFLKQPFHCVHLYILWNCFVWAIDKVE